jgi:hypothetical protein
MTMCRNTNHALLLLAVFLTMAASGDDINLLRLALPSAFALSPAGSFPLDDKNADFVKPSESSASQHQLIGSMPAARRSAGTIQPKPTPLSSALVSSALTHHHLSGNGAMTPLRC